MEEEEKVGKLGSQFEEALIALVYRVVEAEKRIDWVRVDQEDLEVVEFVEKWVAVILGDVSSIGRCVDELKGRRSS